MNYSRAETLTPPSPPPPPPPSPPAEYDEYEYDKHETRKNVSNNIDIDVYSMLKQVIETQSRISNQLEQVTKTMVLMSNTMTQRMNSESFLTYRKIDRLAEALNVQEVHSKFKTSPLTSEPHRAKSSLRK
jgi:hypothetical protein